MNSKNTEMKVIRDVILLSILKKRVLYASCPTATPVIHWVDTEKTIDEYIEWVRENCQMGNYGPNASDDKGMPIFICEMTLESWNTLGYVLDGEYYPSKVEPFYFYE